MQFVCVVFGFLVWVGLSWCLALIVDFVFLVGLGSGMFDLVVF